MYSKSEPETNPFLAGMAAIQDAQEFEIWPENMKSIDLFSKLQTQLRTGGMGGVLGFDYGPYFARMDRMNLTSHEYEWLFDDIRVIESEALKAMNSKD